MKRNTVFYTCVAAASNNISSLHSATILTHTIACLQIYSSQKQNIVIPKMTSEAANSSYSPLFLGREHGKGQIYQL